MFTLPPPLLFLDIYPFAVGTRWRFFLRSNPTRVDECCLLETKNLRLLLPLPIDSTETMERRRGEGGGNKIGYRSPSSFCCGLSCASRDINFDFKILHPVSGTMDGRMGVHVLEDMDRPTDWNKDTYIQNCPGLAGGLDAVGFIAAAFPVSFKVDGVNDAVIFRGEKQRVAIGTPNGSLETPDQVGPLLVRPIRARVPHAEFRSRSRGQQQFATRRKRQMRYSATFICKGKSGDKKN